MSYIPAQSFEAVSRYIYRLDDALSRAKDQLVRDNFETPGRLDYVIKQLTRANHNLVAAIQLLIDADNHLTVPTAEKS